MKYISKFDKTKHTWKVTFSGGVWRPGIAINDELKFSNWPITVNSQFGDMEDTFATAAANIPTVPHFCSLYWNAEVPTFSIRAGTSGAFGVLDNTQVYYPAASTVSVTKETAATNFVWRKDHDPSGFWNPAEPTVFKLHRGVGGAGPSASLPSFTPPTYSEWPEEVTIQRVPAKRVVTRLYTGTQNWLSPSVLVNVTEVLVECWGAGGGAGQRSGSTSGHVGGGGGGGGAYSRSIVTIDPDTLYTLDIGLFTVTPSTFGSNGIDGTNTAFKLSGTALVEAEGGKGGTGGAFGVPGIGGVGGSAAAGIGDVKYSGGSGSTSNTTYVSHGGGSGGWEANGNSPTALDKMPVAVKHGSGGDSNGNIRSRFINHGNGGCNRVDGNYIHGSGLIRISYEYENVDIIERRFTQSTTWTAPEGVTTVNVQCWAAGGGSGGTDGFSGSASGGGGGGAYVWKTVTVVPLTEYTIEVGRGGDGGFVDGSTITNGEDGGDSWFSTSSTVKAAGGKGGTSAALDEDESGGAGGLAADSIGEEKWSGGVGADGLSTSYGGGGGSSASNGSDGSAATAGTGGIAPARGGSGGDAGFVGRFPGGGGGGVQGTGSSDVPPVAGQNGGDGLVILQYAV